MGDETRFSLEELAGAAGMTMRNVRAYQTRGLMPPPTRVGRRSEYGRRHLERLQAIRRAREHGATLALIEEYLARGDTIDLTRLTEPWRAGAVPGPRSADLSGLLTEVRLHEDPAVLGIVEQLIAVGVVTRDGRRIVAGQGLVAAVNGLYRQGLAVATALTVALRAAEGAATLAARVGPLVLSGGREVVDDVAELAALVLRDVVRDGLSVVDAAPDVPRA